jgi:hypothetical protein
VWKRRLLEAFAIITLGDGLIEFLAPREHSRLWVLGPRSTRRIGMWFVEKPDRMRALGAVQVVFGVWLALRQHQLGWAPWTRLPDGIAYTWSWIRALSEDSVGQEARS